MDAIVTRGLTKVYGKRRGILDLDLEVGEGTVFGFLGPNGAGKTTTLRLLMGFLRPDRGEAEILGMPLTGDRAELHRHIGYIPGELALPDGERVGTYLDRCATLQGGVDRSWRRELVDTLALPTQLRIRQLSKGNRQKVALVQALQHQPDLLLLDEPTDGLDPLLRRTVGGLLRQHAAAGGTVFLSSHVVHEVETVCDEVAIVVGGRLRRRASVHDLLHDLPLRVQVQVPASRLATVRAALARFDARAEELGAGEGGATRLRIEAHGDPLPLLAKLAESGARDARFEDKDLEETFVRLYDEADGSGGADAGNAGDPQDARSGGSVR